MPSVDNFYWILYHNLLKPIGLECWYYYPWGTKSDLSIYEFQSWKPRKYDHVLFHFDQEPLWQNNLGQLYEANQERAWSSKNIKILANSEHSCLKKQILKHRQMQDWYFFYHGFAALDWYRDTLYIDEDADIDDAFLSFNHITHGQRAYRLDLTSRLIAKNIANKGKISLHADTTQITKELNDKFSKLSTSSKQRISEHLLGTNRFPWIVDQIDVNGNLSAHCGHHEYKLWQKSLLHIVNETVFYEAKLHLTEKIFKPIVSKRPFVLVAAPGNLAYLRSYGFRTFGNWIDESYDNIQDCDDRLTAISIEIEKISRLDKRQLRALHHDMLETLEFNKQHFFNKFREIIVDELLENFDTCIRIWNNGRVDQRDIPLHSNLSSVRHLLLQ